MCPGIYDPTVESDLSPRPRPYGVDPDEQGWCRKRSSGLSERGRVRHTVSAQHVAVVAPFPAIVPQTIVSGTPYSGSQNRSSFPNGSMMVIVGPPGASRSMPGRSLPAAPLVTCDR